MKPRFDNRFFDQLPVDPSTENIPRQVTAAASSRVAPTPVSSPALLGWSQELANELGISRPDACNPEWLQALAGNDLIDGMQTYSMAYGGHQFGHWAGQLGDGRAIALGEMLGVVGRHWELQLKGAGPTPYSRTADGRAVLRSSLREFLCSEAMHHLGVPTTRALSLVGTGDQVVRDMFYDGNPQAEPGAIVCRVSPSFIRFGSFQLPASRGEVGLLKELTDFTIATHFPEFDLADPDVYVHWFSEICERTAIMVVDWMRVGFVHGVMNTDNMSIHGLTIDYGPYGWLEPYDPHWTPNTTDAEGRRYCFGNQPGIAQWNLAQFGSALTPLTKNIAGLEAALEHYVAVYEATYRKQFALKLGLPDSRVEETERLLKGLFTCFEKTEIDYCLFFRCLAQLHNDEGSATLPDRELLAPLQPAIYAEGVSEQAAADELCLWLRDYLTMFANDPRSATQRRQSMNAVNPKYVPRNYLAQQAIDAAERGDLSELEKLQHVFRRPYDEQPEYEQYSARRPEWARHRAGCSALSCSS